MGETVYTSDNKLVFHEPNTSADKLRRFVGVELEVAATNPTSPDPEGSYIDWGSWSPSLSSYQPITKKRKVRIENPELIKVKRIVQKWNGSIHDDGSLPTDGFEIATAPAIGSDFTKQIREVCEALHKVKATVNEKCGTHIHVDMRDFSYQDIRKLMYLYVKFEGAWVQTQPPKRVLGKYCRPLGPEFLENLDTLTATTPNNMWKFTIDSKLAFHEKYRALNFKAFWEHKTVEVRMHEGTLDPEEIIHWSRCWSIFVQKAKDMTIEQILLQPGGLQNLQKLLGTKSSEYLAHRTEKYAQEWKATKAATPAVLKWAS